IASATWLIIQAPPPTRRPMWWSRHHLRIVVYPLPARAAASARQIDRFIRTLIGGLRMLLGHVRVFSALVVIAPSVAIRLGSMLMMFSSFIVLVSRHLEAPVLSSLKIREVALVPTSNADGIG